MTGHEAGDPALWQWFVAALLAPLTVWVLWRVQVLSVGLLRSRLAGLVRHADWLYHSVSWFGTLLHEMSHATVLLLSGHGIKNFNVQSEQGHVTPRRQHQHGLGMMFFLAAALAPLYLPPALVLTGVLLLFDGDLIPWSDAGLGLAAAGEALRDTVVWFPLHLGQALASLDLRDPGHLLVFLLVLLGAPGSRPSHVKGSRFHGTKDEGDIAVVRRRIRQRPWPFLAFLGVVYGVYFALAPFVPQAYWWPFQAVWAVGLTGVILALFGAAWWWVADVNSRIAPWIGWVPPALLLAGQILPRTWPWLADQGWSIWQINAVSVGAWVVAAVALRWTMPRRDNIDRAIGRR